MIMMRLLCLASLVALASAKITSLDCGNGEVKNAELNVCDCTPCTVYKKDKPILTITFVANADSKTLTIKIFAILAGKKVIQLPLETDACKFVKCPVKKGDLVTLPYTETVPSDLSFSKLDANVKIFSDCGDLMVCATFPEITIANDKGGCHGKGCKDGHGGHGGHDGHGDHGDHGGHDDNGDHGGHDGHGDHGDHGGHDGKDGKGHKGNKDGKGGKDGGMAGMLKDLLPI